MCTMPRAMYAAVNPREFELISIFLFFFASLVIRAAFVDCECPLPCETAPRRILRSADKRENKHPFLIPPRSSVGEFPISLQVD